MKDLYSYIKPKKQIIDAHSHLFDHTGLLSDLYKFPEYVEKVVGFADIRLDEPDKYNNGKIIDLYDKFIKNNYIPGKHILFATSYDIEDAIKIHQKYPEIIKGFGEFKCFKNYFGKNLNMSLDYLTKLLEYNRKYKLPVYIHWNILNETDQKDFENILKEYREFPIVLCHFGMGYDRNNIPDENGYNKTYDLIKELYDNYDNLYLDLSYRSLHYFNRHPEKLNNFDKTRICCGSDINPKSSETLKDVQKYIKMIYNEIQNVYVPEFSECILKITNMI